MGCNACNDMQANPQVQYFIRVGPANVLVLGCLEHVSDLRRLYIMGLHFGTDSKPPNEPVAIDRPPLFNKHLIERNICPECGMSWGERSPNCPRMLFNRHPMDY